MDMKLPRELTSHVRSTPVITVRSRMQDRLRCDSRQNPQPSRSGIVDFSFGSNGTGGPLFGTMDATAEQRERSKEATHSLSAAARVTVGAPLPLDSVSLCLSLSRADLLLRSNFLTRRTMHLLHSFMNPALSPSAPIRGV